MEWREEGTLISVRPHGESAVIAEVFTLGHGRHAGVIRGGASRRIAPLLQPGAQLDITWRSRLEEHIGQFTVEPVRTRAGLLADRLALSAMSAICALLHFALPEREAHERLYHATQSLLEALEAGPDWPVLYLGWELLLLEDLGFGLDLSCCAVTGATGDLAYVSPRSGRAVSRAGAGEWASRLLPLPPCLTGTGPATPKDLADALGTTGHFLEHHLARQLHGRPLPPARMRLVDLLARRARDAGAL